jgi:hypothetical protein
MWALDWWGLVTSVSRLNLNLDTHGLMGGVSCERFSPGIFCSCFVFVFFPDDVFQIYVFSFNQFPSKKESLSIN